MGGAPAVGVVESIGGRDVAVGTLLPHRTRGRDSASFAYRAEFLADAEAHALDPALPLRGGRRLQGHQR
ncbi:hypothetical protein SAMN06264364_11551 [Quadrisphaera granulorum]|uniref:Uncharacterized protein n=1 Tax=Quadrisphaera granulorum TaxID=317664 RepID=A0A316A894_9ACTN|nr:hypothetical protein BXY45_11551 [Quadrisphaera granulorum]SZE97199.1 hypothetical protein SAMN06264364_11551 [Quadrisphaera granulorum]